MLQDFAVQCTWEGDNTVLSLQSGRYLLGCMRTWKEGGTVAGGTSYLNRLPEVLYARCGGNPADLDDLSDAFDMLRASLLERIFLAHGDSRKRGATKEQADHDCSLAFVEVSRMHALGFLFQSFRAKIASADASFAGPLTDLCLLFGLASVKENLGLFLGAQFYAPGQVEMIDRAVAT